MALAISSSLTSTISSTNFYGNAVGDRFCDVDRQRFSGFERSFHRGCVFSLHADDADVWQKAFGGDGDAGNNSAAADRNDDHRCFGTIFRDLQTDSSLPGDHQLVVKSVHVCVAVFFL